MSVVERFSSAASAAGATVHTVDRTSASDRLEELTEAPAVGVPVTIDGVSLPDSADTDPDTEVLRGARTGITESPLAIEPMGSVVIPSDERGTGPVSLYPERQIAIVERDDLVPDVETAFAALADRFRANGNDAVVVTGPSTTGDMGGLVTGVHGPAELHIVVIDE